MPIFDDLQQHVIDAGWPPVTAPTSGKVLYVRGMYAAMLAAEAARTAQEIHGVADITPAMMRDGMEALEMTGTMAKSWAPGIGPEFAVSCEDHSGTGMAIMQQWDGSSG
jgi:branched-chain amino acid transport system substrate-binding protein